ncbi:hypothetical protein [Puniceicoccus vermicola]|nr:hypothetical protein [Puniceicoccus vermicola]MBC2602915.1 hypothetical protein [Puniceicoccus vermicola]
MKTIVILLILSPLLWAAELDDADFSRFILINDGTGANEDEPQEGQKGIVESDLLAEFGFKRLTESEKEEAQRLASEYWFQTYGLLAEERLIPDFSFQLEEEIDGLGSPESKIWQVQVQHMTGGINALIWINAETKETRAWGIERELKEIEQNQSAHTTPASAPR